LDRPLRRAFRLVVPPPKCAYRVVSRTFFRGTPNQMPSLSRPFFCLHFTRGSGAVVFFPVSATLSPLSPPRGNFIFHTIATDPVYAVCGQAFFPTCCVILPAAGAAPRLGGGPLPQHSWRFFPRYGRTFCLRPSLLPPFVCLF